MGFQNLLRLLLRLLLGLLPRCSLRMFLCVVCLAAASGARAAAPLEAATAALAKGELPVALAAARKAAAAHPANYRAHYYVAYILLKMSEPEPAQKAIQEALRFAPAAARAELQTLAQAIQAARHTAQAAARAEAAEAEGMNGKAAALWREAWEAEPRHPDHGMRAAQLYAASLAQPVDAAAILREIATSADDAAIKEKAAGQLAQLAPQLAAIAAAQYQAALNAKGAARLPYLQAVTQADPGFLPAYEMRALIAAESGDMEGIKNVLRELSRRNKLDLSMLKRPEFSHLVKESSFAAWLEDLAGQAAARNLLAELQRAERESAQRARQAQAMQLYQDRLAAYRTALGEHKKYAPCRARAIEDQRICMQGLPPLRGGLFGIGGNGDKVQALRARCQAQGEQRLSQCNAYPAQAPQEPEAPADLLAN